MQDFVYETAPMRVIFARGSVARLANEAQQLGLSRLLVVSTPGLERLVERVASLLGERAVALFGEAVMHTPVEVTDRAMQLVQEHAVDGVVALGGGSSVGLAKAIALRTDLPQIAIPTTYAGSEMTPLLGETQDGRKRTVRSRQVLPEVVLYDIDLAAGLPLEVAVASAMNAMAHAVEALYAPDGNPVVSAMAEEGLRALRGALVGERADVDGLAARSQAQLGAWLCACCLGSVQMGLHHQVCHVLGGMFDLPHAPMHAVMLPHAIAFNAPAAPAMLERIGRALEWRQPASSLWDLQRSLGMAMSLRDLGMPEDGILSAAKAILEKPYPNPRALDAGAVEALLRQAWTGGRPTIA